MNEIQKIEIEELDDPSMILNDTNIPVPLSATDLRSFLGGNKITYTLSGVHKNQKLRWYVSGYTSSTWEFSQGASNAATLLQNVSGFQELYSGTGYNIKGVLDATESSDGLLTGYFHLYFPLDTIPTFTLQSGEVQKLTISGASGPGTWQGVTINLDDTAATVQTNIRALGSSYDNIAISGSSDSGTGNGEYIAYFGVDKGNVSTMSVSGTGYTTSVVRDSYGELPTGTKGSTETQYGYGNIYISGSVVGTSSPAVGVTNAGSGEYELNTANTLDGNMATYTESTDPYMFWNGPEFKYNMGTTTGLNSISIYSNYRASSVAVYGNNTSSFNTMDEEEWGGSPRVYYRYSIPSGDWVDTGQTGEGDEVIYRLDIEITDSRVYSYFLVQMNQSWDPLRLYEMELYVASAPYDGDFTIEFIRSQKDSPQSLIESDTAEVTVSRLQTGSAFEDGSGLKIAHYNGITTPLSTSLTAPPEDLVTYSRDILSYYYPDQNQQTIAGLTNYNWTKIATGKITPKYTEEYWFTWYNDDGCIILIDDVELTKNYYSSSYGNCNKINLEAQKDYTVKILHQQGGGSSHFHLWWWSPSQEQEEVPFTNFTSNSEKYVEVQKLNLEDVTTNISLTLDSDSFSLDPALSESEMEEYINGIISTGSVKVRKKAYQYKKIDPVSMTPLNSSDNLFDGDILTGVPKYSSEGNVDLGSNKKIVGLDLYSYNVTSTQQFEVWGANSSDFSDQVQIFNAAPTNNVNWGNDYGWVNVKRHPQYFGESYGTPNNIYKNSIRFAPDSTAYRYYKVYINYGAYLIPTEWVLYEETAGWNGFIEITFEGANVDTQVSTLTTSTSGVTIETLKGLPPEDVTIDTSDITNKTKNSITLNSPTSLPVGVSELKLQYRKLNSGWEVYQDSVSENDTVLLDELEEGTNYDLRWISYDDSGVINYGQIFGVWTSPSDPDIINVSAEDNVIIVDGYDKVLPKGSSGLKLQIKKSIEDSSAWKTILTGVRPGQVIKIYELETNTEYDLRWVAQGR